MPFRSFLHTDLALSIFLVWDTILLIKKGFKVFVVWCSRAREVLKWASFIFYRWVGDMTNTGGVGHVWCLTIVRPHKSCAHSGVGDLAFALPLDPSADLPQFCCFLVVVLCFCAPFIFVYFPMYGWMFSLSATLPLYIYIYIYIYGILFF